MNLSKVELAWPGGDKPGDLNFNFGVSGDIKDLISATIKPFYCTNTTSIEINALTPPKGIVGRYCLKSAGKEWFVRISSRIGHADLELELCDYLIEQGVSINPILFHGLTRKWEGINYRIDIRPLIRGRHFNGSKEDLANLTSTLKDTHNHLKNFHRRDEIKNIAEARYKKMAEAKSLIQDALKNDSLEIFRDKAVWAMEHKKWLNDMIKNYDPFCQNLPEAQCLHGEVHPGNVIFSLENNKAILVDFEESVHTFAPPSWDLAFMFQRFCLQDNPPPPKIKERLKTMTAAYGEAIPPLALMMRQISWFSMCVILDLVTNSLISTPLSEYNKFISLEHQAESLNGTI